MKMSWYGLFGTMLAMWTLLDPISWRINLDINTQEIPSVIYTLPILKYDNKLICQYNCYIIPCQYDNVEEELGHKCPRKTTSYQQDSSIISTRKYSGHRKAQTQAMKDSQDQMLSMLSGELHTKVFTVLNNVCIQHTVSQRYGITLQLQRRLCIVDLQLYLKLILCTWQLVLHSS